QNIFVLRKALGDSHDRRIILTIPGKGYQFVEEVRDVGEHPEAEAQAPDSSQVSAAGAKPSRMTVEVVKHQPLTGFPRWKIAVVGATAAIAILIFGGLYVRGFRANRLQPEDTIVLGDFANSTDDPIFDDTLKQGLTLTLRQSPFLNILPQSKISKTLRLM